MENNTIELALMEQEERELVEFILKTIPEVDKTSAATEEHPSGYTLTQDDVLFGERRDGVSGRRRGRNRATQLCAQCLPRRRSCDKRRAGPTNTRCRTAIRHRAWLLRGRRVGRFPRKTLLTFCYTLSACGHTSPVASFQRHR